MSILQKLSVGLSKTRASFLGRVQGLLGSRTTVDENLLIQIEEALIAGDVGLEASAAIIARIRKRVREERYASADELMKLLRDEIANLLGADDPQSTGGLSIPSQPRPYVIMVVGVNGAGKTTTVGKLAAQLKASGLRVLVGAADTFRAAANEQLEIWAERAGVAIIRQEHGADAGSVAFDTLSSAVSTNADAVLIDTAGRLHTKVNLMEELRKIRRVIDKRMPGAPHEVLLVLDAGTGQNGLQQARQFAQAAGVTGIVLTKLDGTAKGGIVLSIRTDLNIPIKYVGVGEQLDDLQPFDRKAFVDALFETSGSPTVSVSSTS